MSSDSGDFEVPFFSSGIQYIITPAISCVSAGIILFICFATRAFKEPLQIMVIFISFENFILYSCRTSVAFYPPKSTTHCKILYSFVSFGLQSTILWAAFFGHALLMIVRNNLKCPLGYYLKFYIFFATVIPLCLSLYLSIFADYLQYSDKDLYCYHPVSPNSLDYVSLFYRILPMTIGIFLSLFWYSKTICKLRAMIAREQGGDTSSIKMMALYPGVLLLCWTPAGVTQLIQSIGTEINPTVINLVWGLAHLQGFFNAIVYGGGLKNVAMKLFNIICRCQSRDSRALRDSTLLEPFEQERKDKESNIFVERTTSDLDVLV